MKFVSFFIIGVTLLFSFCVYAREGNCNRFLYGEGFENDELSNTKRFMAYTNHLIDKKIITEENLRRFYDELSDHGVFINSIPHFKVGGAVQFTQSEYQVHYESMEAYITQGGLNKGEVLNWLIEKMAKDKVIKAQKNDINEQTISPFVQMKFHRVAKGKFQSWQPANKIKAFFTKEKVELKTIILTHDIEVMSTLVTQWMWANEVGSNPAKYYDGRDKTIIYKENIEIEAQPDHPVESITWYSAAMFANYMSRKHRLKEAYDFSGVRFKKGTSFENGTLDIESGKARINGRNIYETEGYRLPTRAEQEFLLTGRGRSTTDYSNKKEWKSLGFPDHHITHANTVAVGEIKPLKIDGDDFYDLYGNVYEWGHDTVEEDGYRTKVDPITNSNYQRIISGGSLGEDFLRGGLETRSPRERYDYIGFRLVRTMK